VEAAVKEGSSSVLGAIAHGGVVGIPGSTFGAGGSPPLRGTQWSQQQQQQHSQQKQEVRGLMVPPPGQGKQIAPIQTLMPDDSTASAEALASKQLEEEAKRAADSIASLDEEKYYDEIDEDDEGRMYYDSLRFLSDKKSQTVNVYDIPNFQLTYYLNYNDFLKNNTFEEKKNSCNTCNLIGTSINNNAKLIGYDLLIEMNGKASGKAEELLENLKLVFKNLGLSVEKKGYEYILINTKQNNKKVGSIKSTNDDLVTINFIF
jgi:hypothetical protein